MCDARQKGALDRLEFGDGAPAKSLSGFGADSKVNAGLLPDMFSLMLLSCCSDIEQRELGGHLNNVFPVSQATEPASLPVGLREYTGSEEPLSWTASILPTAAAAAQPTAALSQPQLFGTAAILNTLVASLGPQADSGILPATEAAPVHQTGPAGGSAQDAGAAAAGGADAAQQPAADPAVGPQDGSLSLRLTAGMSEQMRDTPQPQLALAAHRATTQAAPASLAGTPGAPCVLTSSFAPVASTLADTPAPVQRQQAQAAQRAQQAGILASDSQVQPAAGLLALAQPAAVAAPAAAAAVAALAARQDTPATAEPPRVLTASETQDMRSPDVPVIPGTQVGTL